MTCLFSSLKRRIVLAFVSMMLLGAPTCLKAVPPAKPTNGQLSFTHLGYPGNDQTITPTTSWRSWAVSWDDNALDEEGYFVYYRYGNSGPFRLINALPSNTTEVFFSTSVEPVGREIQVKVEPWKYSGKSIEIGAAVFKSHVPARGSQANLAAPTGIVTAPVDLDPSSTVTNLDDGSFNLSWTDNSAAELFYEVRIRDSSAEANPWLSVGRALFSNGGINSDISYTSRWQHNTNSAVISSSRSVQINSATNAVSFLKLIPGKTYQLQIRPTQSAFSFLSWYPPAPVAPATYPSFTVPALKAPGLLNTQVISENQVLLTWVDNSNNETGFVIEAKTDAAEVSSTFTELGTVGANVTSIQVPVTQGVPTAFRVKALYQYTPAGASVLTKLESPASNTSSTGAREFGAPTDLVASTSAMDHAVELTWTDNSSTEYGFDILTKPVGSTSAYRFARAVRGNITRVTVDSMASAVDAVSGRPISSTFEVLIKGTAYEFVVRAVGSNEASVSALSNVATATPKAGFTMLRLYQPAQVGQVFTYQVSTLNSPARSSWNATGLPAGLTFSSTTGAITGTPTQSGVFECPLEAVFADGTIARTTLTLRVLRALGGPQVVAAISNRVMGLNTPLVINLAELFTDGDAETAVRLATTKGDIDMLLYPSLAPEGVANFMAYVNNGAYDNMAFHRLVPGFVLQGGDLRAVSGPRTFSSIQQLVASPQNEPGISNTRGTVAAAKVGGRFSSYTGNGGLTVDRSNEATYGFHGYLGDPNSATTNFFINLAGNQDNLDNQNGGFTAFGRVTNAGMAVTDAISALPTGSYTNSESLIVDGSLSSVSGIPMDAATAPTTMDINKTVRVTRASAIQPLSYTISDGTATSVVATIENGNQLKLNGLAAGSRSLTVTARDLDGNTIGQTFTVTVTPGHKAPTITRQPVAKIVNVGDDVSFSVTATGTDLQYQWRRGGTNLEGKTAATLTLEDVQAGNAGEYDVAVSNATTSVISNRARLSLRTPTDITGITNAAGVAVSSLLVNVGAALELKAVVVGAPEPVFTWKRGTTAIKGQTSSHLKIATAKLTDGGTYKGTAKNAGGTDSTTDVNVFVIDRQNQLQVHKPGVAIKLVAGISGPADQITYQWGKYNDTTFEPLTPSSARYTGVEDPTLTILVSDINQDSGAYACRVSLPDGLGTQTTGLTYLSVANKPNLKPMIGLNEVPTGFVAVSYRYQVPYEPGDALRPSSFAASGLPSGLTIDAPTGIIYGIPTKSGQFTIKVTAKNPSGTSNPVTALLKISSMQAASTGSFVATIQAAPTLNEDMGGRLDMTVTESSSYSASVVMGKNTYKAAGKVLYSGQNSDGSVNYRGQITIPRKNQKSLLMVFVVTSGGSGISGFISDGFFDAVGRLTGETGRAEISGFRRIWNRSRKPSPFLGNLHLSLDLPAADIGKADIPQGSGFLRGTGSSSGTVSFAGRLADGTAVTTSSSVSRLGELILFKMLYSNRGSLSGRVNHVIVSSGELDLIKRASGDVRWFKTDTTSLNPRSYPTGVASTTLAVAGNYYFAPKPEQVEKPKKPDPDKHEIVMGLPNVAGNAYLDFAEGGLVSGVTNPDVNFRITPANKASFTTGSNPGQVTLSIDTKTGLYSGAFNLEDGRSTAFRGLIIPKTEAVNATNANLLAVSSYGVGYFLLPGLTPTLKTSQILSGKVTLQPTPVEISPQPLDQTINPGENVVFTIGVSGGINGPVGSVVTYRWYKDGVPISDATGTTSISGATTNTLTISSAQKANAGSYFCEVTQSVSIVRSNAAVLTVREFVANVTLALQSESVVNLGDSVTFTTTAEGSAPLTYEWSKNGVILPDVTTSSYNINSVTVADTGTYKVKVRNSLSPISSSPAGVESPGVSLNVITPITSVVITRTPSTEFVSTGEEVVFTATANGSSPAYQWRRNNVNIPNAFGRTFTIPIVSNDDGGQYEVYVTNALTPTPVFSEINYLNVAAAITNIQLQKSYTTLGVLPNTSVTFTVTADGENITYQWYKNDAAISGQTSNSLTLNAGPNPTNNVPDVYSVKLFNAVTPSGISGGAIPLHVATPVTDVIVTRDPSTSNVVAGSGPVVFTATPDGTGPYTYQWRKNFQLISDAVSATYTISDPAVGDTGNYDCIITNPLRANEDGITGDSVSLTVVP